MRSSASARGSTRKSRRGSPRSCRNAPFDEVMWMHADLLKLLELQAKDAAIDEIDRRLRDLNAEVAALDQVVQRSRDGLDSARRAAADGARRRDELEAKVDSYRILQDRRVQRLETVRNPKEASTLMAELELTRSVMAKEGPERARLEERRQDLLAEREAALREREASAEQIDKPLRTRYDRLRRARARDVVVPLVGGTCGACHTSIPLNRRGQIRSGAIIDGCEGCGAILYPAETAGSA